MTYNDFWNSYKWSLKKWYMIKNIFEVSNIKLTEVNYIKSGSRWIETGSKEKQIDYEIYMNIVDAIPFFKNLGGTETVKTNYTKYGVIPVEIISTNPGRTQRTTRKFSF